MIAHTLFDHQIITSCQITNAFIPHLVHELVDKKTIGVYVITDVTGSYYIGSGNLMTRLKSHRYDLTRHIHKNCKMQQVFDLYGELQFNVISICDSKVDALTIEHSLINNNWNSDILNMSKNAFYVRLTSNKTLRKKQSIARKRYFDNLSDEERVAHIRPATDAAAIANLGNTHWTNRKPLSEQDRTALSNKMKGNKYNVGVKHIKEFCDNIAKRCSKPCYIDGLHFESNKAAAAHYGIDARRVSDRINSDKYPTWKRSDV